MRISEAFSDSIASFILFKETIKISPPCRPVDYAEKNSVQKEDKRNNGNEDKRIDIRKPKQSVECENECFGMLQFSPKHNYSLGFLLIYKPVYTKSVLRKILATTCTSFHLY